MRFAKSSQINCSALELFRWHERPGAFQRLMPPWEKAEVLHEDPGLQEGKRIEMKLSTPVGPRIWKGEHIDCDFGNGFVDTQIKGPFASWTHRHRFEHVAERSSLLVDEIDFELPGGALGRRFGSGFVKKKLGRSFEYRHAIVRADVDFRNMLPGFRPLRILVTGGSGFLGTQLAALLRTQGHGISTLTRAKRGADDVRWDPEKGEIEISRLEGFDAVIHLAGANLTSGRWTEERKRKLWSSRVDATAFLVNALSRLEKKPSVFLSGSGIGYYGSDAGGSDVEASFDESSRVGEGFLAELCEAWESAAYRAESLGCRVALLRSGVVLDPRGGALKRMLPIFRAGAGGPLGSGEQWFPWIALEDWIRSVNWLLFQGKVRGPVNLVAPLQVRQKDLARALAARLRRPSFVPAPKFALRLALGEMADAALLTSVRASPAALGASGYEFLLPDLERALDFCLE